MSSKNGCSDTIINIINSKIITFITYYNTHFTDIIWYYGILLSKFYIWLYNLIPDCTFSNETNQREQKNLTQKLTKITVSSSILQTCLIITDIQMNGNWSISENRHSWIQMYNTINYSQIVTRASIYSLLINNMIISYATSCF